MTRYHRTRFAPAPTGYLHLGHVVNALAVWGTARAHGAEVALRIEDHDRQRCRPAYEAALLDDLEWLGFVPDAAPIAALRLGPSLWRQSDSGPLYEAAVGRLRDAGHQVYVCDCSRSMLTRDEGQGETAGERPYTGHCRERGLAPGPDRGLRVVMPSGDAHFDDLRLGPQRQDPARQCGDLLLRDRKGNWTYQFAVVVDDARHGIDLVVRGEDLRASTGRQLHLGRLLGRTTPLAYLHHTLILKPGGDKLSKGSGDTGVRELRAAGITREALLGRALHAAGWGDGEGATVSDAIARAGVALTTPRTE